MLPNSLRGFLQRRIEGNQRLEGLSRRIAGMIGYDLLRITRQAYGPACRQLIEGLGPAGLDACEISAGDNEDWRDLGYRSYRSLEWPDFDLAAETLAPELTGKFDLVIANQVFEHLLWPVRGARNIKALLRPGGHALVMTPFLLRIHGSPQDCSRWTEIGLRHLLAEGGFALEDVQAWSWGNKKVARDLLTTWPRMGFRRELPPNEPRWPIVVWALARRGAE
jgi:SAM-dependent methyltransferase